MRMPNILNLPFIPFVILVLTVAIAYSYYFAFSICYTHSGQNDAQKAVSQETILPNSIGILDVPVYNVEFERYTSGFETDQIHMLTNKNTAPVLIREVVLGTTSERTIATYSIPPGETRYPLIHSSGFHIYDETSGGYRGFIGPRRVP